MQSPNDFFAYFIKALFMIVKEWSVVSNNYVLLRVWNVTLTGPRVSFGV